MPCASSQFPEDMADELYFDERSMPFFYFTFTLAFQRYHRAARMPQHRFLLLENIIDANAMLHISLFRHYRLHYCQQKRHAIIFIVSFKIIHSGPSRSGRLRQMQHVRCRICELMSNGRPKRERGRGIMRLLTAATPTMARSVEKPRSRRDANYRPRER